MEDDDADFRSALDAFERVNQGFVVKNQVVYEEAATSLQMALKYISTQEAQQFVHKYMYKIMETLLRQVCVADPHRKKIEFSCLLTVDIIVGLADRDDFIQTLDTVCVLLDTDQKFYSTLSNHWQNAQPPSVNKKFYGEVVLRFARAGGFERLLKITLDESNGQSILWNNPRCSGPYLLSSILGALAHNDPTPVDVVFKSKFVEVVMPLIMDLSEEQLKKEGVCEKLSKVLNTLAVLCEEDINMYYKFCMDYTFKMTTSGTLSLKLFGWEQIDALRVLAIRNHPRAGSYLVQDAGQGYVNGAYTLQQPTLKRNAPRYVKPSTKDGEPELVLTRFDMKGGGQQWFIIQELENEQEIDYYSSTHQNLDMPPSSGWYVYNSDSIDLWPAPFVEPWTYLYPEGMTAEMTLTSILVKWAVDRKLLEEVFGASIHRAVVSNSKKLLQFLASKKAITFDDLSAIWKSALLCDADTADEVFVILAMLATQISDELFGKLVQLVVSSLHAEAKDPNGMLSKVASLVEKFPFPVVKNLHPAVRVSFSFETMLELVWSVYTHAGFASLKNQEAITNTMTHCFEQKSSKTAALRRIKDCAEILRSSCSLGNLDEMAVAAAVNHLIYLLSLRTIQSFFTEVEHLGLPRIFTEELQRFVHANRPKCSTEQGKEWHAKQVATRLGQLRQYYGVPNVGGSEISRDTLNALWQLFKSHPLELDQFFEFLNGGCSHKQKSIGKGLAKIDVLLPIFTVPTKFAVFEDYICSPEVDWTKCGSLAFHSFDQFFLNIQETQISDKSTAIEKGIHTLWNVFKNTADEESAKLAMSSLLKVYAGEGVQGLQTAGNPSLLTKISTILAEHEHAQQAGMLDAARVHVVVRCIELLSDAISTSISPPSHASRGVMGRIDVSFICSKMMPYYNTITRSNSRVNCGEVTVKVNVHPMHTLRQLKGKIAASFPDSSILLKGEMKGVDASHPLQCFPSIADGAILTCNVHLQAKKLSEDVTGLQVSIAEEIGCKKSYFMPLLSFCDVANQPALSQKVWNLLMLLPTAPFFEQELNAVIQGTNLVDTFEKWAPSRVAYALQIFDHKLLPAVEFENEASAEAAATFKRSFLAAGGFSLVLRVLTTFDSDSLSRKVARSAALHILRCLMPSFAEKDKAPRELFEELQKHSLYLVEKLLNVASEAAAGLESDVVQDALSIISDLIQDSSDASTRLVQNPESQKLLATVLKSSSEKVRLMSSDFAVELGKRQQEIFSWMISDLESLDPSICDETFSALNRLLSHFCSAGVNRSIDVSSLGKFLSDKLVSYTVVANSNTDRTALKGYMEMLNTLVAHKPESILQTELGDNFVRYFFDDFLFTVPKSDGATDPVCEEPELRRLAFSAIGSFLAVSNEPFEQVLDKVLHLAQQSLRYSRNSWQQSASHEMKKPGIRFTGLKNQGCTCYMNSTLQQLYMSKAFREAILTAPLKETQRSSILHRSDEELVGLELLMLQQTMVTKSLYAKAGQAKKDAVAVHKVHVLSYNPETGTHKFRYDAHQDAASQEFDSNIRSITGYQFRLAPAEGEEPITPQLDSAIKVVEQLQRTFCYMQYSKKRYFDPIMLVDACKTLGLQYLVTQQNDAAELLEKLLDRIDVVTKVRLPGQSVSMWQDVFCRNVFGGKVTYRKVPLVCSTFEKNRDECGHWLGKKVEDVLMITVQIKSKESISDALDENYAPEVVDGIDCDVCKEKKGANRRALLSTLPNTLVFHLKRFDLDYTTFETTKLNNRHEFPTRINMLKYTVEGVEVEERKKKREAERAAGSPSPSRRRNADGLSYEQPDVVEPDPMDYEYELQGVLIHAGVAGGGHYYSFTRDPDSTEQWYKLDDDDVNTFSMTPDNIAYNCFGGTHNRENGGEETRTANALILFYEKIRPSDNAPEMETAEEAITDKPAVSVEADAALSPPVRLVTGREAYFREVMDSNNEHTLMRYTSDGDLHSLVRIALESLIRSHLVSKQMSPTDVPDVRVYSWNPSSVQHDLPGKTVHLCTNFFLQVVLRCRDRCESDWIDCLKSAFNAFPHTASIFLLQLCSNESTLLDEYLVRSPDPRAKNAFISLVMAAVHTLASQDLNYPSLIAFITGVKPQGPLSACDSLGALLINIHARIYKVPEFLRNADEFFLLISHVASIEPLRRALLEMKTLSLLSYFFLADSKDNSEQTVVNETFIQQFSTISEKKRSEGMWHVGPSVLEAIAAILNVPLKRKVPLAIERKGWQGGLELTPEAQKAFSHIFRTFAIATDYMTENEFYKYCESFDSKPTLLLIRYHFDRYAVNHTVGNVVTLEKFFEFQANRIAQDEKKSWHELQLAGFGNDLKLVDQSDDSDAQGQLDGLTPSEFIPPACFNCLREIHLYLSASYSSKKQATYLIIRDILHKICSRNEEVSLDLLGQALESAVHFALKPPAYNTYNSPLENDDDLHWLIEFIDMICSVPDELMVTRLRFALFNRDSGLIDITRQVATKRIKPMYLRCINWFYHLYTKHTTHFKSFLAEVVDDMFIELMKRSQVTHNENWFRSRCETSLRLVVQTSIPHMSGDYRWHSRRKEYQINVEYWVWDQTGQQGVQQDRYEIVCDLLSSSWRVIAVEGNGAATTTHTCKFSTENRLGTTKCPPQRGWKNMIGGVSDLTVTLKDIEDDGMDTSLNATDDVDDGDEDDVDASSMAAEEGEDEESDDN